MTLWRWQRDLGFSPPDDVVNGRRFWRPSSIEAWWVSRPKSAQARPSPRAKPETVADDHPDQSDDPLERIASALEWIGGSLADLAERLGHIALVMDETTTDPDKNEKRYLRTLRPGD